MTRRSDQKDDEIGASGLVLVRRLGVCLMLWSTSFACGTSRREPNPPPKVRTDEAERIAAIENGIVPIVHIPGEPPTMSIAERMAHYHVPGVSIAVVHDGRIAWAKGYGVLRAGGREAVTDGTLFEAASISKPVTDLAYMTLVQEGKVDLDSSIDRWLKSWHVPAGKTASTARTPTARMIMSHHAGFNVESVAGYVDGKAMPTSLQILNGEQSSQTPAVRLTWPPGEAFHYSGGGLSVLQQALVDTTAEPFDALMRRVVLGPLQMSHSTFSQSKEHLRPYETAHGHAWDGLPWSDSLSYPDMAAAGLRTTPTDLAKVILEIQRALRANGALLAQSSAQQMVTRQFDGPTGLGFFLSGEGVQRRFAHDGSNYGFTCRLVAFAEKGDGAVVMTNQDTGLLMFEVVAAIGRVYGWPDPPKPPRDAEALDPTVAAQYVGEYAWEVDATARVMREGGRLFVKISHDDSRQMDPFPPAELFADSDTRFFTVAPKMSIRFDVAPSGTVLALTHADKEGHEVRALRRR